MKNIVVLNIQLVIGLSSVFHMSWCPSVGILLMLFPVLCGILFCPPVKSKER